MKIIFDFDHTLFATGKSYGFLKNEFEKIGVNNELFSKTFEKSKSKKDNYYRPSVQIKLIKKAEPEIKISDIKKKFQEMFNNAPRCLYSDVLPFLKKWRAVYKLYLLSYGEKKFQKQKIEAAKIKKLFRRIIITEDIEKIRPFKKLFKNNEKIIFVEDNPNTLSSVKKKFKNVITVRINRGHGRYCQEPNNKNIDYLITNLKELEKII